MKVHLIAIGGAVMHNLALALQESGHQVTGSDDEIFEPSLSRLKRKQLLPAYTGWNPAMITTSLDAVILGMHARKDNSELNRALELGLTVYSFPEFVFAQSQHKTRVSVCGSHGKTTITSMVMHALSAQGKAFDYLVGAQLKGFETMVQFTDAPVMVIEGDEYFASAINMEPKFLFYKSQITLISGIAWDHFNVFPTIDGYYEQFRKLIRQGTRDDLLIVNEEDDVLMELIETTETSAQLITYQTFTYNLQADHMEVDYGGSQYPVSIFGRHNISNLAAAAAICNQLGITTTVFLSSMADFAGASKRMECVADNGKRKIFRDFAHAPSKVKATTSAMKEMFPDKTVLAVLELHTFSSLSKEFLPQYAHSLDEADKQIVYYAPHTLTMKNLPPINEQDVQNYFADGNLEIITDANRLGHQIQSADADIILLMSSGNFSNLNIDQLI